MARHTGPVCRLCRREGKKLFLKGSRCETQKCSFEHRDFPPGMHSWRRGKLSDYGVRLREKQKAKRIYGIYERQFKHYFEEAERQTGNTGERLLIILERRLDNVVFHLKFGLSRRHARQLVLHGHFQVNGKKVNIPSYPVKEGDVIKVVNKEKHQKLIQENLKMALATTVRETPSWLELDKEALQGKVIHLPNRQDIKEEIKEQLIVELCSK